MKKMIAIVGAILLVAAVAGGGFYGGMQYQISLEDQAQANFLAARGEGGGQVPGNWVVPEDGQIPTDGQMPMGRQGMGFGSGATGTIKSVDGDILTLSTAENITTVTLSEDTSVVMTVDGALSDLQEGMRVLITGERDEAGNITAVRVQILDDDSVLTRTAP